MRIDILTLFPEIFAPLYASIPGRAQQSGRAEVCLHHLRRWGRGRHKQLDDTPYGGGSGMVMTGPPLLAAIDEVAALTPDPPHVIFMSPQGRRLDQSLVMELLRYPRLLLLCGHYEGVDERVLQARVHRELSIGDFVLSGGELAAMVVSDALLRSLPGVIDEQSLQQDSFYAGLLDYPHYTRPPQLEGREVPAVLLSGDHARIATWRRRESLRRTAERRPELLANADLSSEERAWVAQLLESARTHSDPPQSQG